MSYRVLVVGAGHMGKSHAKAYHAFENTEIVGIVSRSGKSGAELCEILGTDYPQFNDFYEALEETNPDIVVIATYTEYHADYTIKSMEKGAHVFVEKPLGINVEEAQKVVDAAIKYNKKMLIGYILQVHKAWEKFVDIAKTLGKPLVMRMNLNQQSTGSNWETHKNLLKSTSPIVDCGVHYVDVMCKMTEANPVKVHAIGARLSDEIDPKMYNYGQLQVEFDDSSIGWYEVAWGPMISDNAYFIKDVMGPKGSASILGDEDVTTDNVDGHSTVKNIKVNKSTPKEIIHEMVKLEEEQTHDELCVEEQKLLLNAIEEDLDLTPLYNRAINSMKIVEAADQSVKTGQIVEVK